MNVYHHYKLLLLLIFFSSYFLRLGPTLRAYFPPPPLLSQIYGGRTQSHFLNIIIAQIKLLMELIFFSFPRRKTFLVKRVDWLIK